MAGTGGRLKGGGEDEFTRIDLLAKTGDKLGITTEGLATIQLAGKLAGIELEQMNKTLEIMLKNLGDAEFGRGEAIEFLKAMNLEAKTLTRLPVVRQLETILKAIAKFDTRAGRVAALRDTLGRRGRGAAKRALGRRGHTRHRRAQALA